MGTINRESENDIFLGTVNSSADTVSSKGSLWVINLTLNGHPVQFKIDTGADVTVIGETDVTGICVSQGCVFPAHISLWMRVSPHTYH